MPTPAEIEERRWDVTANAALALDASVAAMVVRTAMASPDRRFSVRTIKATGGLLDQVDYLRSLSDGDRASLIAHDREPRSEAMTVRSLAAAATPSEEDGTGERFKAAIKGLIASRDAIRCDTASLRVEIVDSVGASKFLEFLQNLSSSAASRAVASDTQRYSASAVR